MTTTQKTDYKKRLKSQCVDIIQQRIENLKNSMKNAQAAANQEEKSSAGDKYETARAMSHMEKDMHAKQLASNMSELQNLTSVNCDKLYQCAEKGSVVDCETILFFIAAGLGKIVFENTIVYLVSPSAPIFKTLKNKTMGEHFSFSNKDYLINDVY
ncbi:MAG: hypothetical protein ABI683_16210 [Ginsengibacter sp.]